MTFPDPPIRPDGACAACGGSRFKPKLSVLYLRNVKADPFCSTECARLWHGVPLFSPKEREPRGYTSKLDAEPGRV